MKARTRAAVLILSGLVLWVNVSAVAEDIHLRATSPIGLGYVGMYYGLTDLSDEWYATEIEDIIFGGFHTSTTWLAVVDTGASATILGKSTQEAYEAGTHIPMQPYPDVKFSDVGFGGTEDFAVTQSVQVMLAGQKAAAGDTENHSLYTAHTPAMTLAAARDYIGGGVEILPGVRIDLDIIGASILQGQVLQVDPHHLGFLRWVFPTMAGSLVQFPPQAGDNVLYIPMTMQDFCPGTQSVDVGEHPMVPIHVRKDASDAFVARPALFDTGSPVNFVSADFATEAGIDLDNDIPFDIKLISGIGEDQIECPGYYVDALALELGAGRTGDKLVITDTAVFVIPDDEMPCTLDGTICLEAILGNGVFSDYMEVCPDLTIITEETDVVEWYVDLRDGRENLIIVLPEPAGIVLLIAAFPVIFRRRSKTRIAR